MNILKRALWISFASILLLTTTMVWHILAVTKPHANVHHANIQLARIDFATELDAHEAGSIRSAVNALPGVRHARINDARTNLVYSYDRALQDQRRVFVVVKELSPTPCERLVVTAEAAARGCPAMVQGGMDGLGGWISGLMN
ncbi:MAG TPA: hypothetical protein PKJ19_11945 [Flavobacteriales bacterium]|nr:hypothetical protein [Flavobacteriales bacterium]HNU55891.1 hypothetical protein [Flavobacteriales bacterium]